MNVNVTLDGEEITILSMTIERYRALIAYIDSQSGTGNLKITEIPLTDLPLELYHFPVVQCSCAEFQDLFPTITGYWSETDNNNIATPGPNGYEHIVHAADSAILQGIFEIAGENDFDICVEVDISELPGGLTSSTLFGFEIDEEIVPNGGSNAQLYIRGSGVGTAEYFVGGDGSWDGTTSFGVLTAPSTHFLRYTRSGTTLTASVWNSVTEQFEWNGNPAGIDNDQEWDTDPFSKIVWVDNNPGGSDYMGGSCKSFCINVGRDSIPQP